MKRTDDSVVTEVHAALERESLVNLYRAPIEIAQLESGTVSLRGEVVSIEAKRLAVERAKAVNGVHRVIDRLTVRPTSRPGDGAIRDSVSQHLFEEPAFSRMAITCRVEGDTKTISQNLDDAEQAIVVTVADGIITLRGHVLSLSHSRLAAVLAWWAPGCRNVVNELEIRPPEADNDDELSDAIKLVLEKDPLVHGDQIAVRVRNGDVTLRGFVANKEEERIATQDVWYVEGVRSVIDELAMNAAVAPGRPMFSAPPV